VDPESHFITDGRWAFETVGTHSTADDVQNSYGLMRPPWNTAKDVSLRRVNAFCNADHEALPTCEVG
jgi:hypothetical protein